MLSCKNLSVKVDNGRKTILENANVSFKAMSMNAVIGPSGCGKTTLLKAMMKIIPSTGNSYFCGKEISKSEDLIAKVGFAPQFTCAQGKLNVEESIKFALDVSTTSSQKEKAENLEKILKIIGLHNDRDKLVESLSGGQLRRIGLGLELANNPPAMFCDEITSGLDPLSENAILDLLKELCQKESKTFICIIHNLAKLDYFDLITVIFKGNVVFQGSLEELNAYFEIDNPLSLYDKLNTQTLEYWLERRANFNKPATETESFPEIETRARTSLLYQSIIILKRRLKLFFRDSTYLLLSSAITFGFPLMVVIFSLGGLPQIEGLALDRNYGLLEEFQQNIRMQIQAVSTSTLITGLILFQVVLLNLMASNNGAREIASERNLYEKERLIGLNPVAYCLSKIFFVSILSIFQSVWMCAFVKYVCGFPGDFLEQAFVLSMVGLAMTMVCLAFSALSNSADKSSLMSIYLVGFQLPLSGVVLALPDYLVWLCRPFINTYWGWSGYMTTMRDSRIYDTFVQTQLEAPNLPSLFTVSLVLGVHIFIAIYAVFWGCFKKKWA